MQDVSKNICETKWTTLSSSLNYSMILIDQCSKSRWVISFMESIPLLVAL